MKLIAILLVIALIVALAYLAYIVARDGTAGLAALFKQHRQERAEWKVDPRSTGERDQQIWLVRGEDEFFFWPNESTEHLNFDMALLEAEVQAGEFNRVRRAVGA